MTDVRTAYARLFRQAAEEFSELSDPLALHHHQDHCGRMVIESVRRGMIADHEITKAVDWHTASGENDRKPGMQAVYVRCPSNLWLDIAGGHFVHVLNDAGDLKIVKDEETGTERTGGILSPHAPALLRLPEAERYAEVCRILADSIATPAECAITLRPAVRHCVTLDPPQITIDGQAYALKSEQAIYLDELLKAGDWMSDPEFRRRRPEAGDSARPDKWRRALPSEVSLHIETHKSRGQRWKL